MITIEDIKLIIKKNNPQIDLDMLDLAYDTAKKAHEGQKRKDGTDYIHHPIKTAYILAQINMDLTTIIAGILHDVPEDTDTTIEYIEKNFGTEVAKLVNGVTKLGKLKYRGIKRYAENLRRMFIAMADDIRVIIIKLADRIHNLETLSSLPLEKQNRIATESLEIYVPIANRLGIGELKSRMEDLSFKYVYPDEYKSVVKNVKATIKKQHLQIDRLIEKIREFLEKENNIKNLSISGRFKNYYSIYKKLLKKDVDISKIYDIVALRIITKDVATCYRILGLLHSKYKPVYGRIKDYIAQPKPNGYQSLHTTVFDHSGHIIEFQIRDKEMHEHAEYGIAAHWHYKKAGKKALSKIEQNQIKWIQELLEWQKKIKDDKQYLKVIKVDIFQDRIFVFTPDGDVVDLPKNSTLIDFAYNIHSDIGNKCTGAIVNKKIASLDTKLLSGDIVKIIIDKNRAGPSEDWLTFIKTNQAKSHIKAYVRKKRKKLLDQKKSI